jgi:hypothetical protein
MSVFPEASEVNPVRDCIHMLKAETLQSFSRIHCMQSGKPNRGTFSKN